MGMVRVLVEMPEELRDAMKQYAFENKTTMGAIVCQGVAHVIDRNDIAPPPKRKPGPQTTQNQLRYCLNLRGQRVIAPRFLQPESVQQRMPPSSMTEEQRTAYYIEQFGENWRNVQVVE